MHDLTGSGLCNPGFTGTTPDKHLSQVSVPSQSFQHQQHKDGKKKLFLIKIK